MRVVGSWMLGIGGVQAGTALIRLAVALLPEPTHRDPPLWSAGVLAGSAALHVLIGRRLIAGRHGTGARSVVAVAIVGWLLLTLVSLNTSTIDPGALEGGSAGTLAAAWRGAGWPGMLTWADAFTWVPTGRWTFVGVALAGLSVALGLALAYRLLTAPPAAADSAATRAARGAILRRPPARGRWPFAGARGLGIAVALHLAVLIFLTIAVLVGLSFRVAGAPFF